MNHNELKAKALRKQSVHDKYDALESEFSLLQTKLGLLQGDSKFGQSFVRAGWRGMNTARFR